MGRDDGDTTIQELKELVITFSKDRHWERYHTPKNLSTNIAIEAAELMEHYVWDQPVNKEEVADELSDVLFNILNFAHRENIDISSSFKSKYKKVLKKFPVEIFEKSDDLSDYHRIKQQYRAKKDTK